MHHKHKNIKKTLRIKNMLCHCCERLIYLELKALNIDVLEINQGSISILINQSAFDMSIIEKMLANNGMSLIKSKDEQQVENIKLAVNELIHMMNNVNSIAQKSDYLVEKLGMSYQSISKIFSKYEHITLEKYIILNKIERIKELIRNNEYTLSEIAYMMDYNSVQYLSNQFKKITGITVSEFKESI